MTIREREPRPRVVAGLPKGLAANPRLSRWVSVAPDGMVTVRVGKVELGQGIVTALAQLAADELDVDLADVRMLPASTAEGPDEGLTAGSMSPTPAPRCGRPAPRFGPGSWPRPSPRSPSTPTP